MHKRISLLVVMLLCILIVSCQPTQTPPEAIEIDGFEIILTEPEIDFPQSITFKIEAGSDTGISNITLNYQVDRLNPLPVTSAAFPEFEPGTQVETSWTWDMKISGGLPPGADLEYWWSIEDTRGEKVETPPAEISFDDNQYSWNSMSSGQVTLLWYEGSNSFAGSLMETAWQALNRLAEDTGTSLEGGARIYIYDGSQDLLGALVYPQEWTGGVAFTEFSTIAIGISPKNLDWGKGAIAHELAHLAIHHFIFNGYGVELPTWLDEGLAMHAEGELSGDFQYNLEESIANDTLFSVKSLCSSFPAQDSEARLAYAQSYSLVEYLLEEQGGQEKMLDLLEAFSQGSGYVEALDKVYGLDIEQLDSLWQDYIGV